MESNSMFFLSSSVQLSRVHFNKVQNETLFLHHFKLTALAGGVRSSLFSPLEHKELLGTLPNSPSFTHTHTHKQTQTHHNITSLSAIHDMLKDLCDNRDAEIRGIADE